MVGMSEEGRRTFPSSASSEVGREDARRGATAEAAVVEALRRGDEEAFSLLVDQHHQALGRIARLYVSSPAVAEEVVQETWLAVIRGLWAFEGRSSLRTWIVRILINRAKTHAIRERRMVPLAEAGLDEDQAREDPSAPTGPKGGDRSPFRGGGTRVDCRTKANRGRPSPRDPGPSPEAMLLGREARERIRGAIEALPESQRLVMTMRDVEGFSSEEVCNVLGLTETNQRVILHRARSRVRSALAPYVGEERA